MRYLSFVTMGLALVLNAAIFGFFYAWVVSTMWGLDVADPRVAIDAMQAMNASVRNAVFAPAFFGTPFALWLAALVLRKTGASRSAAFFAAAGGVYFVLGMLLTMMINVPMNEALALVDIPDDIEQARAIWADYSERWQFWNQFRTVTSGFAFVLALIGVFCFETEGKREKLAG